MAINLSNLPAAVANLIKGRLYGLVYPMRQAPQPLSVDGRTIALQTLAQYIAALTFYRPGAAGQPPIPFTIPTDRFFIEQPDVKTSMTFPCISVVHDTASYDVIGLVSYVEEDSLDVYGKGTLVQWQSEYVENIQLEVWCNERAERRAILGQIETSMSPTEQQSGVRFHMPDYYDQLVCFTLNNRLLVDGPDAARGRRSATLGIEMRFNIVKLINVGLMTPVVTTNVDVAADGTPVTSTENSVPP